MAHRQRTRSSASSDSNWSKDTTGSSLVPTALPETDSPRDTVIGLHPQASRDRNARAVRQRQARPQSQEPQEGFIDSHITSLLPERFALDVRGSQPLSQPFDAAEPVPKISLNVQPQQHNTIVGHATSEADVKHRCYSKQNGNSITKAFDARGNPIMLVMKSRKRYFDLKDAFGRPVKQNHIAFARGFETKAKRQAYVKEAQKKWQATRTAAINQYDQEMRSWRCRERERQLGIVEAEWAAGNRRIFRDNVDRLAINQVRTWVEGENQLDKDGKYAQTSSFTGRAGGEIVDGLNFNNPPVRSSAVNSGSEPTTSPRSPEEQPSSPRARPYGQRPQNSRSLRPSTLESRRRREQSPSVAQTMVPGYEDDYGERPVHYRNWRQALDENEIDLWLRRQLDTARSDQLYEFVTVMNIEARENIPQSIINEVQVHPQRLLELLRVHDRNIGRRQIDGAPRTRLPGYRFVSPPHQATRDPASDDLRAAYFDQSPSQNHGTLTQQDSSAQDGPTLSTPLEQTATSIPDWSPTTQATSTPDLETPSPINTIEREEDSSSTISRVTEPASLLIQPMKAVNPADIIDLTETGSPRSSPSTSHSQGNWLTFDGFEDNGDSMDIDPSTLRASPEAPSDTSSDPSVLDLPVAFNNDSNPLGATDLEKTSPATAQDAIQDQEMHDGEAEAESGRPDAVASEDARPARTIRRRLSEFFGFH